MPLPIKPELRDVGWHNWGSRFGQKAVVFLAFSWGVAAFTPVGVMYLHLLLLSLALLACGDVPQRWRRVRSSGYVLPVLAMLLWAAIATLVGDWYPDTATRLFHVVRVALVLALGLMLAPREAVVALAGFVVGALLAALVVAVHQVWGLPPWTIWASLLSSRNNFSSGNMITMAIASAVCLIVALGKPTDRAGRWIAFTAAIVLTVTVSSHAVSRNAQLLLAILPFCAVLCRFRLTSATIAGVLAVFALAGVMWQFSPTTHDRFKELAGNLQLAQASADFGTSGGVRLRMYEEALQGMAEHPLTGTGLGSWLPHWTNVWKTQDEQASIESRQQFANINNPHNDFLLNGMETGVAGMLILVWILARFIVTGWRRRSIAGDISVMMAVGLFVTAMVNAPFRDAALGMTLLWLLAVSAAVREVSSDA